MSATGRSASNVIDLNVAGRRQAKIFAAAQVISIDYRSIVEEAVAGLIHNTPDSRREVYAQARATVNRHLQLMRLPEPIVGLETLSLDLTIRKIERQWRSRQAAEIAIPELDDEPAADGVPDLDAAPSLREALAALVRPLKVLAVSLGLRPLFSLLRVLLWPVRMALRFLLSPIGLAVALPVAALAIFVIYFVDNNVAYKTLADGPAGRWISQLNFTPSATHPRARSKAADANTAAAPQRQTAARARPVVAEEPATPVAEPPAPPVAADVPQGAAAIASEPYRGPSRLHPIRAEFPGAAATVPEAPPVTPTQQADPCSALPLPTDPRGCAIVMGAGPQPAAETTSDFDGRPRWLKGYASINDVAAARSVPAPTEAAPPPAPIARPANPKLAALIESGRKWSTKGDLEHAVRDFSEAIRLDPKYPDSYAERGQALFKMGETERAIADYSAAIQRDPEHGSALRARGMAYLYRGSPDLALADLSRAIGLAERDPSMLAPIELFYARRSRASIYSSKQQYDLEIGDCTALIESQARDPMVAEALKQNYGDVGGANVMAAIYRQRATAQIKRSNWDLAIADLTAAMPLSYDHGYAALMDRSKLHEGLGQRDEAIADLQSALAVRPGSEEVRLALRRLGALPKLPGAM
jgi:tetratricopeptide (TPR) repeat protein